MLGERTWTSAMSGAATKTVEAGPGSLSAVPLLTSSVSVGGSVGTIWLWANGRPCAPPVTAGWLGVPAAGGWIGTGAGVGAGVGAWANFGIGATGCGCSTIVGGAAAGGGETRSGWPRSTPGVSAALAIGALGGMAATVGGRESTGVTAASFTAGAMAAGALIERTTEAARSASRRLRSSETLSVAVVRDGFLAGGGGALGLVWTRSGSLIWTCASSSEGWNVKASDATSATDEPARRHADGRVCANEGVIAARSGKCG